MVTVVKVKQHDLDKVIVGCDHDKRTRGFPGSRGGGGRAGGRGPGNVDGGGVEDIVW